MKTVKAATCLAAATVMWPAAVWSADDGVETVPVGQPAAAPAPEAAADEAASGGIATVVVTARRTAENLQEVPIAITAMSADDLQREQINSPQDLQGRVPSLVVGTNSQMRNTESPTIRGQGAQFGSSPGVVIYLGEVALPSDPVANYQGGPAKFFDLSNIQVLKGSQGTLFGRNTTGGALLLEPHKPDEEFSASLRGEVGNYGGEGYESIVNVPLIEQTLLMRAGFKYYNRNGFTKDVATGTDYDSKNYWAGRVGLTWRPAEGVDNYLMAYYGDSRDNGTATVIEDINRQGLNESIPAAIGLGVVGQILNIPIIEPLNAGCLLLDILGPSTNCGQDILDEQAARGHRKVQLSGEPDDILKSGTVLDNFSLDLTDSLKLRNIVSYSTMKHHYRWDLDGSRAAINEFINPSDMYQTDVDVWTEELQLQGAALDDALKYVVGGYYEKAKANGEVVARSLLFVDVFQKYDQEKESYAPFVQGTLDLGTWTETLEGLSLTLGARYTTDETTGTALLQQTAVIIPLVDKEHDASTKSSEVTWTAGLDYKFGANLVYGKVSRGYKTGGISVIVVNPAHYTYDPEFVTNYEIGQKSDFEIGSMPVRLNSAVYYTDYSDMQTAAPDSYVDPNAPSPVPQLGQAVLNVGKAWMAGFETDVTVQPLDGVTVVGTYGYTKGKYTKFDLLYGGATSQLDCSREERNRGDVLELSCLPFKTAPKHQFSLSGRYLLPLDPAIGDVEISTTYAWTDRQYSAQTTLPEDEPGAWLPSMGLLNASVSWRGILGSRFDLQVFGTNLTDEEKRVSNSNQWHLTYIRSSIYSEPRFYGMQLGYRFGG